MIIRKELNAQEVELEVRGNLNADSVGEFRDAMHAELDSPQKSIRLDLEKVKAINSAAIGALLLFRKKAQEKGKNVRIQKCSDDLRKTLLAIRFDKIMEMPEETPPGARH